MIFSPGSYLLLRRAWILPAWLLAAFMLGCTLPKPPQAASRNTESGCDGEVSPADKTRLAGIEQMIGEGKVYAALAQLETLRSQAPLVRLTQAEALRRTDAPDRARAIYTNLLDTCHKGRAHHGLGLLLALQGDETGSLAHLQRARAELPTDVRVRNDLGFALLLVGRHEEARFEFLTAMDLEPGDTHAARNHILLLLKQEDASRAQALADKLGLDKATMDKLTKQAAELPTGPAHPVGPTSTGSGTAP